MARGIFEAGLRDMSASQQGMRASKGSDSQLEKYKGQYERSEGQLEGSEG